MQTFIKPRRLLAGDTVAAVSLSWGGPATFPHRYRAGVEQFEREFGVRVVEARHALRPADWLAANPKARADDLMEAFVDPSVHGIISTIGGDDSVLMLPHVDLGVIRGHPKVFMGYSDSTVTNFACLAAGIVSFSGPSFMAGFGESGGIFTYTAGSVRRTLFKAAPIGRVEPNADGWTVEHLDWADPTNQARRRRLTPSTGWRWLQGTGTANGHLIGGCMDVMEWLKGTPWWPSPEVWQGAILFVETSEEAPPPYAVKRWLRNYGSAGILDRLAGVLVGRPGGQVPESSFDRYDAVILEVIAGEFGLTSLPVVSRMDFGHTDPMCVLPLGVMATIDCDGRTLTIDESAVA